MSKHTPGPWHWSISPRFKDIRLDNTAGLVVMDFARWGMQSAQPRFRGILDIMFETSDIIGNEDMWPHPDARLIAAAPDLLAACNELIGVASWLRSFYNDVMNTTPEYAELCGDWNATSYLMAEAENITERARAAIEKAQP